MLQAVFHAQARATIQAFSKEARFALGSAILDLQHGAHIGMPLSRAMPAVGMGVHELRVRDRSGIYRVFYVVKSEKGILVFHAFEKRTAKTPRHEIAIGKARLREML